MSENEVDVTIGIKVVTTELENANKLMKEFIQSFDALRSVTSVPIAQPQAESARNLARSWIEGTRSMQQFYPVGKTVDDLLRSLSVGSDMARGSAAELAGANETLRKSLGMTKAEFNKYWSAATKTPEVDFEAWQQGYAKVAAQAGIGARDFAKLMQTANQVRQVLRTVFKVEGAEVIPAKLKLDQAELDRTIETMRKQLNIQAEIEVPKVDLKGVSEGSDVARAEILQISGASETLRQSLGMSKKAFQEFWGAAFYMPEPSYKEWEASLRQLGTQSRKSKSDIDTLVSGAGQLRNIVRGLFTAGPRVSIFKFDTKKGEVDLTETLSKIEKETQIRIGTEIEIPSDIRFLQTLAQGSDMARGKILELSGASEVLRNSLGMASSDFNKLWELAFKVSPSADIKEWAKDIDKLGLASGMSKKEIEDMVGKIQAFREIGRELFKVPETEEIKIKNIGIDAGTLKNILDDMSRQLNLSVGVTFEGGRIDVDPYANMRLAVAGINKELQTEAMLEFAATNAHKLDAKSLAELSGMLGISGDALAEQGKKMEQTSDGWRMYRSYIMGTRAALGPVAFMFRDLTMQVYWASLGFLFLTMTMTRNERALLTQQQRAFDLAQAYYNLGKLSKEARDAAIEYGAGSDEAREANVRYAMAQAQLELQEKSLAVSIKTGSYQQLQFIASLIPLTVNTIWTLQQAMGGLSGVMAALRTNTLNTAITNWMLGSTTKDTSTATFGLTIAQGGAVISSTKIKGALGAATGGMFVHKAATDAASASHIAFKFVAGAVIGGLIALAGYLAITAWAQMETERQMKETTEAARKQAEAWGTLGDEVYDVTKIFSGYEITIRPVNRLMREVGVSVDDLQKGIGNLTPSSWEDITESVRTFNEEVMYFEDPYKDSLKSLKEYNSTIQQVNYSLGGGGNLDTNLEINKNINVILGEVNPEVNIPNIVLPTIEVPTIPTPDINVNVATPNVVVMSPEVPEIPSISIPKIVLPSIEVPPITAPIVNVDVASPNVEVTPPDVPEFPSISIPRISMPSIEIPKIDSPTVNVRVNVPDVELPRIESPRIEVNVPRIEIPVVSIPKIDTPQVNIPDITVQTKVPEINIPDISVPSIVLPRIEVPKIDTPIVNIGTPEVNIPPINVPNLVLPDINPIVNIPDVNIPQTIVNVPEIDVPMLEVPDVDIPNISIPNMVLPRIEVPKIESPTIEVNTEVQEIEAPSITVPSVEVPKIEAPNVNVNIPVPEVQVPRMNIPNLVLPEINPIVNISNIPQPIVNIPKIEIPRIESPDVNIPEIESPQVEMPRINLPSIVVPKISSPEVNVPEIESPSVQVPSISIPEISIPKIIIPQIQVPEIPTPIVTLTGIVGGRAINISVSFPNLIIREEADILKIAQSIDAIFQNNYYNTGGIPNV